MKWRQAKLGSIREKELCGTLDKKKSPFPCCRESVHPCGKVVKKFANDSKQVLGKSAPILPTDKIQLGSHLAWQSVPKTQTLCSANDCADTKRSAQRKSMRFCPDWWVGDPNKFLGKNQTKIPRHSSLQGGVCPKPKFPPQMPP